MGRELLIDTITAIPPAKGLEGLSAGDAERHLDLPGASHSIAEIVAHMAYWQAWFIGRVGSSGEPMPATASLGWPAVEQGDWPRIQQRFLDGLEEAATLDRAKTVSPPFEFPPMADYTAADVVVHIATHNAHHLGQVILLRQCLGLWPPPDGSWTW